MCEKKWDGKCGPHCTWFALNDDDMSFCLFMDQFKPEKDDKWHIYDGDSCSVPPTGPWCWDMRQVPNDGTKIRLRFESIHPSAPPYEDYDGFWFKLLKKWSINENIAHDLGTPIAFAIINKPWEGKP